MQQDKIANKEIKFVELKEQVSLAGGNQRQLTGHEAGRVIGFGCITSD